ncbi:hypothetical protein [Moraxella lacunata]
MIKFIKKLLIVGGFHDKLIRWSHDCSISVTDIFIKTYYFNSS